jgi:hypothetical protein
MSASKQSRVGIHILITPVVFEFAFGAYQQVVWLWSEVSYANITRVYRWCKFPQLIRIRHSSRSWSCPVDVDTELIP